MKPFLSIVVVIDTALPCASTTLTWLVPCEGCSAIGPQATGGVNSARDEATGSNIASPSRVESWRRE